MSRLSPTRTKFRYVTVPAQASDPTDHRIPSCLIPRLLPHRISANTGNEKISQLILIHHTIRTVLIYAIETLRTRSHK
ncbi:hypothetical protein CY34DRAFT_804347 [Suillus luteus UH-Slu-Lm8-n1]|uniref:Uncharacterized protein n=1 Tax=Suillus luteus UH-Slu-Lm8-n1 TaxID=930992 RepID=A0A0D0BIE6_9AGAM|nr:hypothetical protein CY34DRAFT_804347 [Suillus luteus UH-Slu-Lm8-n1]